MPQVFSNRELPPSLTETGRHQIEALEARLPTGESWLYEPKLDGFRGHLWHRSGAVAELLSRMMPPCTLIDGEIIIADSNGHVDFGALQARLSIARAHVSRTVVERPAVLIVCDVLQLEGCDLTDKPLIARRGQLEQLLKPRVASVPSADRANVGRAVSGLGHDHAF